MQIPSVLRHIYISAVVILVALLLLVALMFPLWGFALFSSQIMTAVIVGYLWLGVGIVVWRMKSYA